jgi:beta-lactamase regulating signal transducer with metallopeptidase domain
MNQIFLTIINNAVSAGWFIIAVIILRLVLKKAPKWISCLLWALVALRLIVPFQNLRLESVFGLMQTTDVVPMNIEYSDTPAIDTGIQTFDNLVNPVITDNFAPKKQDSVNPLQVWIKTLSVVWAVGIILMLIYMSASYYAVRRKVCNSVRVNDGSCEWYSCGNIVSPFILGVIRPRIYLPDKLDLDAREYVLAHEKAHLKRGDNFWKPLGFVILAVYWFAPLCWIAYILLCRDIEYACDERAIRDMDKERRADYCQALLDCSSQMRKTIAACPVAFGEVGVKERIKSVIKYKNPAFWIVIAALCVCVIAALCFMTSPSNKYFLKNVEPQDVSYISVFDGNNGQKFTIENEDEIAYIVNNIKSIPAERGKISLGYSGYSFRMTFVDNNGGTITEFILNNGSVRKDPFFYILDSGDCFDYINELEEQYTGTGNIDAETINTYDYIASGTEYDEAYPDGINGTMMDYE